MLKKSERIVIDVRLWGHPGMGRYLRELTAAMVDIQGPARFHFLGYRKDLQSILQRWKTGVSCREVRSPVYSIREQLEIAAFAGSGLLHVPHFNIPVMRRGKLVVTVHDLTYLHDAKASKSRLGKPYTEFLFRQIAKKASAIMTVSEYTRNDLLNLFPQISPERVFVAHEAASSAFYPVRETGVLEETRKRFGFSKPFVLFVGSLKEHKNIPVLMDAVRSVRTEKKADIELVIVGRKDPKNTGLWNSIQQNNSFVKYLGELSDADLALAYNLAEIFVLPSYREGFGLPVLEAMACGTPVVVSNRTSLPEVAGTAALTFDPDRAEELSAHIGHVLTNREVRERLSAAGIMRAADFSWAKTAQKTLEVYAKAAG